jgi:hypothetical protein
MRHRSAVKATEENMCRLLISLAAYAKRIATKSRLAPVARRVRLEVQTLEARALPSATPLNAAAALSPQALAIVGRSHQSIDSIAFSPDSKHLAFAAVDNNSGKVIEDGRVIASGYQHFADFQFSPNSKHLAFVGYTGTIVNTMYSTTAQVFEDGKALGPVFSGQFLQDTVVFLQFSTNSKHLAFVGDAKGYEAVEDGKVVGTAHQSVGFATFSPDSKHLAFVTSDNQMSQIIEDGKAVGAAHQFVGSPTFSPDSKHLVFTASDNNSGVVIKDGKVIASGYQTFEQVQFSGDGKHLAFFGYSTTFDSTQGSWTTTAQVFEDGVAVGGVFSSTSSSIWTIPVNSLQFSPDGKHLAFAGSTQNGGAVIEGGKSIATRYQSFSQLVFSRDSKHLAYVGSNVDSSSFTTTSQVFEDGMAVAGPYHRYIADPVSDLAFSRDSKHLAFTAHDDTMGTAVIEDGRVMAWGYDSFTFLFSSDSKHLAVLGSTTVPQGDPGFSTYSTTAQVFEDSSAVGGVFNITSFLTETIPVTSLQFSAGGKHLAFVGQTANGAEAIEDGRVIATHHAIPFLLFGPNGKYLALATSDNVNNSTTGAVYKGAS